MMISSDFKDADFLAQCCQLIYQDDGAKQVHTFIAESFTGENSGLYTYDKITGAEVYLFSNQDFTFIVFKATKEREDWLTNLDAGFCESTIGRVHCGFDRAYKGLQVEVINFLKNHHNESKQLVITGHSQGGALAAVCSAHLHAIMKFAVNKVVTFGAPRAFSFKAGSLYKGYGIPHHRFNCAGDIVPRMPKPWMGYRHVGHHEYFSMDGKYSRNPSKVTLLLDRLSDYISEFAHKELFDSEDHSLRRYRENILRQTSWA